MTNDREFVEQGDVVPSGTPVLQPDAKNKEETENKPLKNDKEEDSIDEN